MDTAYLFMAIAFGVSFVLGLQTAKTWIPVCLSTLAPSIAILALQGFPAKDMGQYFALVGPFLIAATIWYAIIGLVGARFGQRVRKRINSTKRMEADN